MKKEPKKSAYSQPKFLITFAIVMGLFATVRHVFSIDVPLHVAAPASAMKADAETDNATAKVTNHTEETWANEEAVATPPIDSTTTEETAATEPSSAEAPSEEVALAETPSAATTLAALPTPAFPTHRIRGVWSYIECFPDVQDVQIRAARRHGIRPVRNRKEAEKLVKSHKLVNICHSPFYTVDSLTHSIPYLVPRAQHLLNTICLNFVDSCLAKGLPPHLPMVTSVLRTTDDVSNLQRGNQNATTNSCHCYGTTVDIAYNRFMPVTGSYSRQAELLRWNEPMKQVLAEVLSDLRRQEKCYVKYEVKQGCFHLTCR